jgi:N-methylhydantoinase A
MPAAVWPREAGVLCALGALEGGSRRERSRSLLVDARDTVALTRAFARLEREVRATFAPRERARLVLEHRAEVRVRGQAHELSVPAQPIAGLAARFHAAHERRFGFADPAAALEVVTVEVGGSLAQALPRERASRRATPEARRTVEVWHEGRRRRAVALTREALPAAGLAGPAIVSDAGATLWVAPGWRARRHASGAVVVTRGGRS